MAHSRSPHIPGRPLNAGIIGVVFLLAARQLLAQCPSDALRAVSCAPSPGDLNQDINYYGGILDDADRGGPTCAANAAGRLTARLDEAIATGKQFDRFLEGAHVTLIFAAALRIGGRDLMTTALDNDLQYVRSQYLQFGGVNAVDPSCGFANGRWELGNTCMEDFTVAADAYGWIAGYEFRAGRVANAEAAKNLANQAIKCAPGDTSKCALGDTSVCIYNPNLGFDPSRGPCNATVADLVTGAATVVSLNHGFQNIAYGLGLMPLVAGGHLGLRVANSGLLFSNDQTAIAQGIFQEAQLASDAQGVNFLSNCYLFPSAQNHYCTDGLPSDCSTLPPTQYACPTVYPINLFYRNHFGGVPNPSLFQFNVTGNQFTENDLCAIMGVGRRILFQTLAYTWFVNTPSLRGKFDGYVDAADCQFITGWAWDSTLPNTPINVDIYDGPTLVATIPANVFRSDLAAKGNGFHAFSWPIPGSLKNGAAHTISVNFGGTGTPLGNTPLSISCAPPAYQGVFDAADCNAISGWAWDQTQPNTPINVTITYDGGSLLGTFSANLFRSDLLAAGIGNGYHAFSVTTPQYLKNGSHSIAVAFPNGSGLTSSPRSIFCQPPVSLTGVFPTFGPTAGGSLVMIRGSGFQPGANVQFGGVAGTGVTLVDSSTLKVTTQAQAAGPVDVVVTNPDGQTVRLPGGFSYGGINAYSLPSCRVVDTRNPDGTYGGPALSGGMPRVFPMPGQCGIPATAKALMVNIAVVSPTSDGYLIVYPANLPVPGTSTANYSAGLVARSGNSIVGLDAYGQLAVVASSNVHFILDVTGYLQ